MPSKAVIFFPNHNLPFVLNTTKPVQFQILNKSLVSFCFVFSFSPQIIGFPFTPTSAETFGAPPPSDWILCKAEQPLVYVGRLLYSVMSNLTENVFIII